MHPPPSVHPPPLFKALMLAFTDVMRRSVSTLHAWLWTPANTHERPGGSAAVLKRGSVEGAPHAAQVGDRE